jgi:hypothetical protein
LARQFPQVRVVRQTGHPHDQALLQLGLDHTDSQLVVVFDPQTPIDSTKLREMWELRQDPELVLARTAMPQEPSLMDRLRSWALQLNAQDTVPTVCGGFQLLRRRALLDLNAEERPTSLRRRPRAGAGYEPKAPRT